MSNASLCASAPVEFQFQSNTVRTVAINGEVWFLARDVLVSLGYSKSSLEQVSNVIKAIPEEWRTLKPIKGRDIHFISEQGLYFFLGRSDKPKALPFQKWLAGEVLPAIRKTGKYSVSQSPTFRLENGQEYVLSVNQNGLSIKPKKDYHEDIIRALSNPDDTTFPDETLKTVIDVCVSTLHYRLKAERLKTAEADLLSDPLMKKALPKGGAK